MGFALPWVLFGMAAAAAPVLIHLMRRRDLPVMPLPTIALLRRAQVRSRRRMRLVDLLLMIARALLLALLAAAVAQPYVSVTLAWGDGRVASVALVVDDSMSMSREEGGTTLLERGLHRAGQVIDSLPSGSEVAVVLAGAPSRTLVDRTTDLDRVAAALGDVPSTSARGTDLGGAVGRAMQSLAGSTHDVRRMVVLSDFARHANAGDVPWPEHDVEVELDRLGEADPAPNWTVAEALAVPDPTTPGQASVRITVRAFGQPEGNATVRLLAGDRELGQRQITTASGMGRTILHVPVDEGELAARVVLDEQGPDALEADDARGVLLRAPPAARVLLVDGAPHPSRRHDEVAFLAQALEVTPSEKGAVRYRIVDPDALATTSLAEFDVVVLANVPPPPPDVAEALARFVARGGGLLVAAGDRVTGRTYARRLTTVLPAVPGPEAPVEGSGLVPGQVKELTAPRGLARVRTTKRLTLEAAGPGAGVALQFADGTPALVVGRYEDGRTAVLATTLDDDWTDLPLRPGFVPLLAGVLGYLAPGARMPDRAFAPGETVPLPVPPGASRLVVVAPDGRTTDLDPDDERHTIPFDRTTTPGAYVVQVGLDGAPEDDPRTSFVVAPPLAESDLSPDDLPKPAAVTAEASVDGATVRRSLAPWLFVLVGLLFLAEGLLRQRVARTPVV